MEELKKDDFHQQCKKHLKNLEEILEVRLLELSKAPKGRLKVRKRKGKRLYCQEGLPKESPKYLIDPGPLAQKMYNKNLVRFLRKATNILNTYIKNLEAWKEYSSKIDPDIKSFIKPITLDDKVYQEEWHKECQMDKEVFQLQDSYKAQTPSEVHIAEALKKYNIPFEYHSPIYLKGTGSFYPTFKCLNLNNRKTFLWEHLPIDDNQDPVGIIHRLNLAGYVQGLNLLITFENPAYPLTNRSIDQVIQSFLI